MAREQKEEPILIERANGKFTREDKWDKAMTWVASLAEQAGFVSGGTFTMPDGETGGLWEDMEEYWALDTWRETQQAAWLLEERLGYLQPSRGRGWYRGPGLAGSGRVLAHNIRAIDNGAVGDLSDEEWARILEHFDESCAYCGAEHVALHLEHVVPIARGGATTKENIVPACSSCNSRKHARTPQEWLPRERFEAFRVRHDALLTLEAAL